MLFRSRRKKKERVKIATMIIVVVVICIGILLQMAVSKQKIRDERRFADMKQMQTVLNYHFELYNAYPVSDTFMCFSQVGDLIEGLVPWLVTLPSDPQGGSSAEDPEAACYNYRSDTGKGYKIRASLERNSFSVEEDGGASDTWYEIFTTNARDW